MFCLLKILIRLKRGGKVLISFKKKDFYPIMNTSKKNILEFNNLTYYGDPYKEDNLDIPSIKISAVSGKFVSGEIYYALFNFWENQYKFLEFFSGRMNRHVKIYGEVLYNGEEREWDDWSKKSCFIILDSSFNKYNNIILYLEANLKMIYPDRVDFNDMIQEIMTKSYNIIEESGIKINDINITSYIVACTLLNPDVLFIANYFIMTSPEDRTFLDLYLRQYVKDNNTILVLLDAVDIYDNAFISTLKSNILVFNLGVLVYSGLSEEYYNSMYNIAKKIYPKINNEQDILDVANDAICEENNKCLQDLQLETKSKSSNNIYITTAEINRKDVIDIIKIRLLYSFYFPQLHITTTAALFFIFNFALYLSNDATNLQAHSLTSDPRKCGFIDSFYIALLLFKKYYIFLSTSVIVFTFTDAMIRRDYSDFLYSKLLSPSSVILAKYLFYNAPGYLIFALIMFLNLLYNQSNINLYSTVFLIILGFFHLFLIERFSLLLESLCSIKTSKIISMIYLIISVFMMNFNLYYDDFVRFVYLFLCFLDPSFLLIFISEYFLLKYALKSTASLIFKKFYIDNQSNLINALKSKNGYFLADVINKKETIKCEDVLELVGLPKNIFLVILLFVSVLSTVTVVGFFLWRKKILPNIRLKYS